MGSFTSRCFRDAVATLLAFGVPVAMLAAGPNSFVQHNLVSNTAGVADVTDPNLVDPWGVSFSATGPFWVSDHVSGVSTLYNGAGAITALVVTVPAGGGSKATGRPTGQVNNSTTAFLLPSGVKSSFIFATEDGTIAAWQAGATAVTIVDNSATAVYKGLAINPSATAPLLYATNFKQNRIDVFNGTFAPTTVPGGFVDAAIPAGFAPFNIWPLNGKLYVTYAKQNAAGTLDVAAPGNGFVDVFDFNGNLLSHLISNGVLNSPWGLALAPAGFGAFPGALLVGNFGDGTINAFNPASGAPLGTLQNTSGTPITNAGLWALIVGNGKTGGDPNTVYFVAGVPNSSSTPRGILGSIAPPAAISAIYNGAGGQSTAVAPGEVVTIVGQTVGASPAVSGTIPALGNLGSTLAATSVTFNGLPAPILYSSSVQTSVVVPYGLAGSGTASVVMKTTGGQTTAAFSIPVVATVPGVFAVNGGGTGAAVVLNQDGTLNSATNGAAKGSVVVLFATGEGQTAPAGQDGLVLTTDVFREPLLPVSLTIGGVTAQVLYAGSAPGGLSGVMEVEALVPATAASGADAVVLTVGTVNSQGNMTVSIK